MFTEGATGQRQVACGRGRDQCQSHPVRGGAGGRGTAAEVDEVKGLKGMKKGSVREKKRKEEVSVLAEKMVTRGGDGRGR